MASNYQIAKKYSSVAFDLAKKNDLIDQFLIDLNKFSSAFSNSISKELSNPSISKSNLSIIVDEFGQKLSLNAKVIDFLKIVAVSRRIVLVKEIEQNFIHLAKREKNIIEAEIISAVLLNEEILREIKLILQKKYLGFAIEIKQIIKKDILGGLIIKIGSNMIDASLRRQLLALKNELCQ